MITKIHNKFKNIHFAIRTHWLHAILGFTSIFEGIILLVDDSYFIYPPYLQQEMNNDIIGFIALLIGIKLIRWCLNKDRTIKQDRNLLIVSSGFFGFISVAELMQIFAPEHNAHVLTCAITNMALLFIAFFLSSVSNKDIN